MLTESFQDNNMEHSPSALKGSSPPPPACSLTSKTECEGDTELAGEE